MRGGAPKACWTEGRYHYHAATLDIWSILSFLDSIATGGAMHGETASCWRHYLPGHLCSILHHKCYQEWRLKYSHSDPSHLSVPVAIEAVHGLPERSGSPRQTGDRRGRIIYLLRGAQGKCDLGSVLGTFGYFMY